MRGLPLLSTLVALALALAAEPAGGAAAPTRRVASDPDFRRGVFFNGYHRDAYNSEAADRALEALATTGANAAGITANFYQDAGRSSAVYRDGELTPSDEALARAIRRAHALGLRVFLVPHLLVKDGTWHAEVDPEDPDAWFATYTDVLLHYAHLAEEHGVEELSIGVELYGVVVRYPQRWREVIAQVRQVYSGQLTYGANWWAPERPEYWQVEFWDDLDYVGIQAYFSLTTTPRPTREELLAAWQPWVQDVARLVRQVQKPVVFTEVGYRSIEAAPGWPWDANRDGAVSPETQAAAYEALLQAWGDRPWFRGVFWWYWQPDPRAGGPHDDDFTPQGKPAQEVLRTWYGGPQPALGEDGAPPAVEASAAPPTPVPQPATCGQRVLRERGPRALLTAEASARCGLRWTWQNSGAAALDVLLVDREGAVLWRRGVRLPPLAGAAEGRTPVWPMRVKVPAPPASVP